jgi:hypothetical protein
MKKINIKKTTTKLFLVCLMAACVFQTYQPEAATKPAKAKITSVSSKKAGSVTVKYKKVKNATGYQIQVATNSKFTKNRKSIKVKKVTGTIKNLKKGKKYYVRVRAYRNVKKNTYYGSWSAKKIVTVKKSKSHISTLTVTKANAATAKKMDELLRTGKSFKIKVKGSKTSSKKLLEKVQYLTRDYNGYGVLPDFGNLYYAGRYNEIDYVKMQYEKSGDYGIYIVNKFASKEYVSALRYFKMALKGKKINEYSSLQSAVMVSATIAYYSDLDDPDDDNMIVTNYMTYSFQREYDLFNSLRKGYGTLEKYEIYDLLYKKKLEGMCGDYEMVSTMILDNFGNDIKIWDFDDWDMNHSWLAFRLKDSSGNVYYAGINQGVYEPFWTYDRDEARKHGVYHGTSSVNVRQGNDMKPIMGKYWPY